MASNEITIHEKNNKPFHISRGDINRPFTILEKYPLSLYLILSLFFYTLYICFKTALGPGYCKFRVIAYIKLKYICFISPYFLSNMGTLRNLWAPCKIRDKIFENCDFKMKFTCTKIEVYLSISMSFLWASLKNEIIIAESTPKVSLCICKRDKNYTCKTKAWSRAHLRERKSSG